MVKPKPPRPNPFVKDSKVLVSKVRASKNILYDIKRAVKLIGGFEKIIKPGDTVMLRPNFNSPDPPPGSISLDFLLAVVKLLRAAGATQLILTEQSGVGFVPTAGVLERLGIPEFCKKHKIRLLILDKRRFIEIDVSGRYLRKVRFSKDVYDLYDKAKFVYLPILKVHKWARFTLSLKLCMAYPADKDRFAIHAARLEEKIAELNKVVHPDLIIMDGRLSFVTRGPERGDVVKPGVILASGDRVAIDVEALKILKRYKAKNRLGMPVWQFPQIKVAAQLGLGIRGPQDYRVVK